MKTIYLAGGCFWGMQRFFDQFEGVLATEVGYANGPDRAPSYEEVCRSSGHAETVRIDYDEARISLTKLLDLYFTVIDPLSVNRQGEDSGVQYRKGVFYTDEAQLPEIRAVFGREEEKVRNGMVSIRRIDRGGEGGAGARRPSRAAAQFLLRRGVPPEVSGEEPRRLLPHPAGVLPYGGRTEVARKREKAP